MANIPRVMIAAPSSGSGKSVIAAGLMEIFSRQFCVQAFKVGPDYIDPMYHTAATGRVSRNLDTWMLSPQVAMKIFFHAAQGASLNVIEGVMGLFDGYDSDPYNGSSAYLAILLQCPLILVLDCSKMSGSAAAVAHGMNTFSKSLHLSGVICNRVGSESHAQWLKKAIEEYASVPVLGMIPNLPALRIPERQLGLFTVAENPTTAKEFLRQAATALSQHLELDRILAIARSAPPLPTPDDLTVSKLASEPIAKLAVARDEAFCFYYEDNLELLRRAGARIIYFSPLKDESLPEGVDGIYFGGGYPELYAAQLNRNGRLRKQILGCIQQQMPVYAECGGLMYLTDGIICDQGRIPMTGALPGWCELNDQLTMGYREVTTLQPTLLAESGGKLRGHEFHYSHWLSVHAQSAAYQISSRRADSEPKLEGFASQNVLASYVHLHFAQDPQLAQRFVERCRAWKCAQHSMLGGNHR